MTYIPFYTDVQMLTEWLAYVDEGGTMPYNEYKLYNPMVLASAAPLAALLAA